MLDVPRHRQALRMVKVEGQMVMRMAKAPAALGKSSTFRTMGARHRMGKGREAWDLVKRR